MKKILAVIICIVICACVFAACSGKQSDAKNGDTTSAAVSENVSGEGTTENPREGAVIDGADALNLIQSYSPEELSISKKDKKKASFLLAEQPVEIEGEKYVKLTAAFKKESVDKDGNTHVTFDHIGEYYISFDGKKMLKKDMSETEKDVYTEMEVKEVPTKAAPAESDEHDHDHDHE